ncbi:LysR substrate-binding domain-containing protein [Aliidongia dinghuensis]|uniref:LysR substrate-binding domain-containing protein n=1 Tax=Aliidongia dinghuensis TaxID=1867774 RepID=UPI001E308930|nr:LysR substrate-binding domain-containing protein [Aliidongia dinghuensis]
MSRMRQLEAFHAVMESGSVTRAAEILQVSQPAITKLIQALEQETGLRLFDRVRRRLQPTREARRFAIEVERLFLTMNRIEHVANEIRSLGTGEMHVAAMASLGVRFLPEILTAFRRERPGVNVALTVTSSQNVVEMVQAGQVDLGFALSVAHSPAVVVQPLASLPGVVVLPRDHPLAGRAVLAPEDLRDAPFVQLGREDRARHIIEDLFLQRGVALESMVQTHLAVSACEFVAAGAGVAVVEPVTASYYRDRLAVRPMAPAIYFEMFVVTALSRPGSAMIDGFVATVRERLGVLAAEFAS